MTVRVERRGPISIFTIDRPAKRNAFDAVTTEALDAALNEFEDDDSALVGILTGGPKFFCAGTDIVATAGTPTERGGPYGIAGRNFTKPVIAAVEGVAAGGGFEIALSATMVVASSTATFSFPEVGLGLVAECGGLFRGPRALPLNIAREMLLTGARLDAQRAYELGLVNKVSEPEHALDEALRLAELIVAQAPIAIRETLHAVESLYSRSDNDNWAVTAEAKTVVRSSSDSVEGVTAFTEKRAPRWAGR
ncbi:enoyl-CoA hydratase [Rhodococcus sp. 06-156-3C]|uniref:enoyl-CoA hydratase-related protein n=1 Tax=Nocardiaceae TaxID=85025 RepID=UPI0005230B2D|nr:MULTISPECIES: enoyl-CoA hydratase-related protein [Rhodococcus]OZD13079.1 enoyl-CoA hydratase [Rhodococcus sp. 06-156-4a]OZD17948.1 enoyl-CoA hydratase [Rhodococcus sp. 06-156-3C]OZD20672.1 enoyl-CoA hydratase [Rhodococcus sp. 06-156-4C]OZD30610.1 enoyl-CoA hydratase [Rhodococcus sp. 06-156-3b]OZD32618.1 enoyl-CoA hydratase [Rhodococcus sp. 06-156-3]